jgi:hypothetical protein
MNSFLEMVTAPLQLLAEERDLRVFRGEDSLQPLDPLRGKSQFAQPWSSGVAPWKRWC